MVMTFSQSLSAKLVCPPLLALLVASGCSSATHSNQPSSDAGSSPALTAGTAGTDALVGGAGGDSSSGGDPGAGTSAGVGIGGSTKGGAGGGASGEAGAGAGGRGTSGEAGGGTGGSSSGTPCAMSNGVCVAAGTCMPRGGTVVASGPGGCQGECCAPPQPSPSGSTCNDLGGLCVFLPDCSGGGGYLVHKKTSDCNNVNPPFGCCVPRSRCGEQTIDCCEGDGINGVRTYSPECDDGKLVCRFGEPRPAGTCK